MKKLSRRNLLLSGGQALAATSSLRAAQSNSPNNRIQVALVGSGGRGRFVLGQFVNFPDVSANVVCDVDETSGAKGLREVLGGKGEVVKDYRRILDRKDIDAVIVATPDHWHALAAIHACEAGKDVYVEKPIGYSIFEGRRMINAARRYGRIVQSGIQQQSGPHYAQAAELVQSGKLGKVTHVRIWNHDNRWPGIGFPKDTQPPASLDWDAWLGPAPVVPYNPIRGSSNFRGFWDYAGGTVTDWGTHHFGSLHHVMGQNTPLSVVATGGKLAIQDIFETPDTLNAVWEYPGGWTVEYSLRQANAHNPEGTHYGLMFYGTDATLYLDRKGYEVIPEKERAVAARVGQPKVDNFNPDDLNPPHIRNFLDCMRTRQRPVADVEVGHKATAAVHLANISVRTGRKLLWDGEREQIIGDPAASALLTRPFRPPYLLPEV